MHPLLLLAVHSRFFDCGPPLIRSHLRIEAAQNLKNRSRKKAPSETLNAHITEDNLFIGRHDLHRF